MDYLREQDMYVALAFIATTTDGNNVLQTDVGHGSSSARPCTTIATCLTRIPPTRIPTTIATRRRKLRKRSGPRLSSLINQARYYMDGADVAYVNPNAPQWAAMADIELVRLDRAVRGDPSPQSAADAVAGKKTLRETHEELGQGKRGPVEEGGVRARKGQGGGGRAGRPCTWSYSRNPDDSDDEREEQLPHNPRSE